MSRRVRRRRFIELTLGSGSLALLGGCGSQTGRPPLRTNKRVPATPPPAVVSTTAAGDDDRDALPDGLDPRDFTMYARTPLTLETRRTHMGAGPLTPLSLLFVRNNLPMPPPSIVERPDDWEVELLGVGAPGRVTLAALRRLGVHTVAAVLQCSGNGRRYFPHEPSGSPWGTGAAGCVLWTGVRLRDVVEAFGGVVTGMKYLTATGGETLPKLPEGVDPNQLLVERSIPADKALDDCLLAWELNGAPLPRTHGGPLRLVVPGWYGVNNIKYVRRIAFTEAESPARIQRSSYRLRPKGEPGSPAQPSMYRMNVKSWINGPGAEGRPILAGPVTFYGVAFSGERGVGGVEVSVDGGERWAPATFVGPDLGPNAWRAFAFEAELPIGRHRVVSRATDAAGETQPAERVDNERGYGNNSWRDMALEVEAVDELPELPPDEPAPAPATAREPVTLSAAGERGKQLFVGLETPCSTCHRLSDAYANMAIGPDLDALRPERARVINALQQGVGAMPSYKDRLTASQLEDLATYVFEATR